MELLEEQRETWGSRGGFVLAAVGSAVGLGNLWGFPYKLYDNGGAAFLIPYIIAMFLVGIPVLILEFSMGHLSQRAAPDAFAATGKRLEFVGWWGIIMGFIIITFYPVILAYCFNFLGHSIQGIFNGGQLPWAGEGIEGVEKAKDFFYKEYLGHTEGPGLGEIRLNIVLTLFIAWLVMYFCIFRGVKLVSKIVWLTVPLPWLMLLVLTINGLMLPGSMKGLAYYLNPDWSELAKPTTWQFAFGQAFFSLSLAFGVMLTYASFLHRKSDINNNATVIGLADFATSFIAGLAIFATLGGMAFVTAEAGNPVAVEDVVAGGPGLAFVAFPYALAQLPGSAWWSFVFFFTLVTLGIDSAFSITESVLAAIVDKTAWRRSIVLPVMSLVGLGFGLVFTTQGGLNWLGTVADAIYGTWGIGLVGLAECILLGWLWRVDHLRRHANERSDWQLGRWWTYAIRIFIPIILGTIFIWSLVNDLTTPHGFLKGPDGQWDLFGFLKGPDGQWELFKCVGLAVVISAPIIAVLMSMIKSPRNSGGGVPQHPAARAGWVSGRVPGTIALLLSIASAAVLIPSLAGLTIAGSIGTYLKIESIVMAIGAVAVSSYVLDKADDNGRRPSSLAQWAGIISTMDISAFFALCLIGMTSEAVDAARPVSAAENLSETSYAILAVVLLLIIGGLSWCFYRALTAAGRDAPPQSADGIIM